MNLLEKAEMVARWAHRDQTDMEGLPYWTHCLRVAGNLKALGYEDKIQVIGWLHDVVEDTELSLDDLRSLGFGSRVIQGVEAMTQYQGEPLEKYWERVSMNDDAVVVKVFGDVPDNDDPQRRRRAVASGRMSPKLANKLEQKYKRLRETLMPDDQGQDH